MSRIYEGMFLIDNDAVRAGWPAAKSIVTDLIAKHGGVVETARRWAERPLAYPIKRRRRATYLLVHFTMGREAIAPFQRDLEINESILRYLQLAVDEVPAKERELSAAEEGPDFVVPEPPADDVVTVEAAEETPAEETPATAEKGEQDGQAAAPAEASAAEPTPATEEKAEEKAEPALAASSDNDEKKEG